MENVFTPAVPSVEVRCVFFDVVLAYNTSTYMKYLFVVVIWLFSWLPFFVDKSQTGGIYFPLNGGPCITVLSELEDKRCSN